MQNKICAFSLISASVVYFVAESKRYESGEMYGLWVLIVLLLLVLAIWTIFRLRKIGMAHASRLGVGALGLLFLLPESYPLYYVAIAAYVFFVVVAGMLLLKPENSVSEL